MPRTIAIDFDGVLHSYASGWLGASTLPDPPVPGAQVFVASLLGAGYDVVVYSTRAAHPLGRRAIREWLESSGFPAARLSRPTDETTRETVFWISPDKPPALVYIDDRALRFEGPPWPTLAQIETAARPWNKP